MAPATEFAEPAIRVEHLDVSFKVRAKANLGVRDLVRSGFRSRPTRTIESVRDVSLEIRTGEVVGLIGRNGAGKSTLLSAMAGLLPPTSGQVLVRAQPTLLGVGAALIPKLSGDTNITIGGLAMGLPTRELADLHAYVRDFTELGEALERPMNTYSSGMKARLTFAIATFRRPEIMMIDEALAVGDQDFREKSLARVRELQSHAGTVIMATHNFNEIRKTCSRVIWLEQGSVEMDGPVRPVLRAYKDAVKRERSGPPAPPADDSPSGDGAPPRSAVESGSTSGAAPDADAS